MIIVACEGVIMLKYQFDYQQNTLAYQKDELWHQIAEEQQFTGKFGGSGFKLNNGWITFSLNRKNIRVCGKQVDKWGYVAYYAKYLPKKVPILFTLTNKMK